MRFEVLDIGVEEDDNAAAAGGKAPAHRLALAPRRQLSVAGGPVGRLGDRDDAGAGGEGDRRCGVLGPVVDHEQLVDEPDVVHELPAHRLDDGTHCRRLVASGDADRDPQVPLHRSQLENRKVRVVV